MRGGYRGPWYVVERDASGSREFRHIVLSTRSRKTVCGIPVTTVSGTLARYKTCTQCLSIYKAKG